MVAFKKVQGKPLYVTNFKLTFALDKLTSLPIKIGNENLTELHLWETLKLFSQGGLFEAKLEPADTTIHPNFDSLYEETEESKEQPIPEMVKHLIDAH